ncbi:MAG: SapC family protein [Pseudomonadales bacterium]
MANLLFYDKPAALNKVAHKDFKIKPVEGDFGFARNTNSVILAGVEFTEAAKEYPIVFAKAGDNIVPVALLGLRNEENLFVDDQGKWDARYIPAFVRRYPFVLAETAEQGQRMVCIDESYPGFNKNEGEPLFENDEPTRLLKQAIEFLEEYQRQYLRTERFVKRLQDNDLLMSLNARIDMVDGKQFSLSGLLAVDEKKLLALPDDKALELFRSGELAWLYCHLTSLGTLARMVDRVADRAGGEDSPSGGGGEQSPTGKKAAPAKKVAAKESAKARK